MVRDVRLDPLLALISISSWVAATEPAPAQPETAALELVSLRYTGELGCPTESQFVDEVLARVTRPVQFGIPGAKIRMAVTLSRSGAQSAGKLEVERAAGEPTRRDFTAGSCDEVGSALALVAALALDPNARTESLPVRAASTQPGSAAATAGAPLPASEPEAAAASEPPASAHPAPAARYAAWIGPSAGLTLGAAPKLLGLVGLSLGVRVVTERPLAPSLQLTPLWGKTGATGPASGKGEFAWALGRLEACPVSWHLSAPLRLDPCAAVEIGRLSARGADAQIDVPVTAERWWVAPGATLSLHANFGGWFVRIGALALIPATRDEFVFLQPDRRVHEPSAVVGGASLGLGFQLGE
jgi:hypothetical protein